MSTAELFILALALSMDAFAVAVCRGLAVPKAGIKEGLTAGLYFGGFQALMPLLGYILGVQFRAYITSVDHWIAFILLGIIGLQMIRESREKEDGAETPCLHAENPFAVKTMLVLAVATSIDALAVGITLAFLEAPILPAVLLTGATTFCLSAAGVRIGNIFGARYKAKAELAGGIVLILIGTKILAEHLGILG